MVRFSVLQTHKREGPPAGGPWPFFGQPITPSRDPNEADATSGGCAKATMFRVTKQRVIRYTAARSRQIGITVLDCDVNGLIGRRAGRWDLDHADVLRTGAGLEHSCHCRGRPICRHCDRLIDGNDITEGNRVSGCVR